MSVVVAVRVRPFNQRELDLNSKLCIDMDGPKTTLLCLEDSKKNKDFSFDYSFWSHDGFEINEDGLAVSVSQKYADQRHVYNTVGKQILDNAWQGYHCCLFAYGQTGAGKSYSMVGYGANRGIVPIACEEIFNRIAQNTNPNLEFEVFCSMLEIYNENVQDLLIHVTKRPHGGLKIRQNQSVGFYVDGLSKHPVESYKSIEKIMETGTQNRTVAATQMNACSSRAHTIIIIQFKQTEIRDTRKFEKLSVINLVDLAGSEKVGKTGAEGARLKEASNINQSLTTLGKVIQTLAEKEMGKAKGAVVPYRESSLTKILCNALGGNSKTLMICAVSPSNDNFDETLSTLRYADQAKKIKNKATVNESATDKLIRELTEENEKLKVFMQKFQEQFGFDLANMDIKNIEKLDPKKYNIQEFKQKKEEIEANEHLLEDTTKTKEQRIQENKQNEEDLKIDKSKPYLCNIHEDPQLHNRVQISLAKDVTIVGSKYAEPKPDIIVGLTKQNIAYIYYVEKENEETQEIEKQLFIEPYQLGGQEHESYILLNGYPVKERMELLNYDRVIFSTTSMFICVFEGKESRNENLRLEEIDYEFVQEEIQNYMEMQNKLRLQEIEEKNAQLEKINIQKKAEQQKIWEEQKQQLEDKIKLLQQNNYNSNTAANNSPVKQTIQNAVVKNKFKDKNYLENKLQKLLPKVLEINLIAKELKRNISLQAKIASDIDNQTTSLESQTSKIQIQVDNRELGQVYIWDQQKFNERYYLIKDLLEKYFETNEIPDLNSQNDPFYDPPEPHIIGNGYFKLLYLAYFMDSQIDLSLVGENGQCGTLNVSLIPCNETGDKNLAEEMENENSENIIEDPVQLLGKQLFFKIVISKAQLPELFCRDTYVEYSLINQQGVMETFQTGKVIGKNSHPNYNYQKIHSYSCVTQDHLNYLQNKNLIFKVLGLEEIKGDNKIQTQIPVEEEIEYANIKNQHKIQQQQQQLQSQQLQQQSYTYEQQIQKQQNNLKKEQINQKKNIQNQQQILQSQTQQQQQQQQTQQQSQQQKSQKQDDCNIY